MLRKAFDAIPAVVLLLSLAACATGFAKSADEQQDVSKLDNCTADRGQGYIDEGRYSQAIRAFTCVINLQPTEVEGYRGRIEAELLLGEYSNAVRDYTRITAVVLAAHPDAQNTILASYAARLAI